MDSPGLVGMVRDAMGRLRSLAADPLHWIIRMVSVAALLLVWKKSGAPAFGWETVAVALLLGIAALMAEYYFSREVCRCWHERAAVPLMLFAVLWAGAFLYSCNNWLGVASEGQVEKAGVQKAAFASSESASAEKAAAFSELNRQRETVERIKTERWKPLPSVAGNPVGSAAEARQLVERAKGNTRFWTLTAECSVTKGPDTRKYCAEYREARAAVAAAETREELAPALKLAEDRLAHLEQSYTKASAAVAAAPVAMSAERADLRIYTKYFGASQEGAMDMQAIGTIVFVSLLLSGLGFMAESRGHRGQPRRPWPFIAAIRYWVFGGSRPADAEPTGALRRAREQALAMIDAEAERAMRMA